MSTVAGLISALANTAFGRIVLASGTYDLYATLIITRSVILEAAPGATVVLHARATSASRRHVLKIDLGSSDVVQLIGLSITGGYADEDGGGVRVSGGTVTMSSCTISGNTAGGIANGADRRGGGVCVWSGTVTFSSCTITGNTGNDGGGVYLREGIVAFSSCIITGNTANSGGGGVYVFGATVAISSCTMSGNTGDGPNIYVWANWGATVCSWPTVAPELAKT